MNRLRPALPPSSLTVLYGRRYRALVLRATFASVLSGEVIAFRRQDLDLEERSARIRAAYVERSTGELLLGPPSNEPEAGRGPRR